MVKQNAPLLGRTGFIKEGGLTFRVKIVDIKQSYGRTRYLVEPVSGKGQEWRENVIEEQ